MKNTNIYVFIVIAPCRNIGKLRRLPEAKEKQKFYNFPFTVCFFSANLLWKTQIFKGYEFSENQKFFSCLYFDDVFLGLLNFIGKYFVASEWDFVSCMKLKSVQEAIFRHVLFLNFSCSEGIKRCNKFGYLWFFRILVKIKFLG